MEANVTPQAAPAPMVPPPAAAPMAAPMAAPPMAPPPFEDGGAIVKKGGGIKEWFSDINIVDVAVSAVIVGAVLYTVHYYKFMMMLEKSGYSDLNTKVSKLQSAVDAQKAEMNAAGNGKLDRQRRRPVMRLA
ncbi:hypothetical protein CCP3SC1AL1_420002 [Gammaproteobacteria bacterium]|jgi:hypothetical protein